MAVVRDRLSNISTKCHESHVCAPSNLFRSFFLLTTFAGWQPQSFTLWITFPPIFHVAFSDNCIKVHHSLNCFQNWSSSHLLTIIKFDSWNKQLADEYLSQWSFTSAGIQLFPNWEKLNPKKEEKVVQATKITSTLTGKPHKNLVLGKQIILS